MKKKAAPRWLTMQLERCRNAIRFALLRILLANVASSGDDAEFRLARLTIARRSGSGFKVSHRSVLGISLFLIVMCGDCLALNPQSHISQYAHIARRDDEGGFVGAPSAIAQTLDGYLWIGTSSGLVRFDGVRFQSWKSADGPDLYQGEIYSLLGATDGSLWVGSNLGLASLKDGIVTEYKPQASVRAIAEDQNGNIWIARSLTHDPRSLCEVVDRELRCYGQAEGLPSSRGESLLIDHHGDFWIGTEGALYKWKPNRSLGEFFRSRLPGAIEGVVALAESSDGTVWAGISRRGSGMGLQQIRGALVHNDQVEGLNPQALVVSSLLIDKDQALWIGTLGQGLFRVYRNTADHFGSADGLSSDSIESLYEDREGSIWVATANGIDSFHERPTVTFSTKEGLSADRAEAILASSKGAIYVSNVGALDVIDGKGTRSISRENGLPGEQPGGLFEDRNHDLWFGVGGKLAFYDGSHFRTISGEHDRPLGTVMSITQDNAGDIWAATHIPKTYLVHIHDFKVVEQIPLAPDRYALALGRDPGGGVWLGLRSGGLAHYQNGDLEYVTAAPGFFSNMVSNVFVDDDGTVWGATEQGVMLWKQGTFRMIGPREGLPCDVASNITRDLHQNLWINSPCGFVMIQGSDLLRWWQHPSGRLATHTLDNLDGFQAGTASYEPGISLGPDGRLWIANGFTVQMLDPDRLNLNVQVPPVHVEEMIADGKSYSGFSSLRLPPLTRDLEIDYTALSFVIPQRVRFRYRLIGRDRGWREAGTRRQAFYTDLSPGNYRFEVIACNNDGVWNTIGAGIDFHLTPAYYQTVWFRSLIGLCVAVTLWLLYRMRLRRVTAQVQLRLNERIVERERIARELHDTLLQGFQSLVLRFQGAMKRMPENNSDRTTLVNALDRAEDVLAQGRDRVRDLRSENQTAGSLATLLSSYADELNATGHISLRTSTIGQPQELHPIVLGNVERIGHETIANAFQHSRASQVTIEIHFERPAFHLTIRDDGIGTNPEVLAHGRAGHWGMQGMRERAEEIGGRLAISSQPELGTRIDLSIPGTIAYRKAGTSNLSGWIRRLLAR
jgi:signal transduction histidine kinase/ligand-binding sensor domain-containing protein